MKKKFIIISSIILLILVCFISTIYALWYISENKIIKPSELTKEVVESYIQEAANETYTYGGGTSLNNDPSPQLPLSSKLDNNELIYYYKLETEETWVKAEKNGNVVTNGPLVVGKYDIYVTYDKITINDEGNEVKETIKIENIQFDIIPYTIDVSSLTQTTDLVYTKQAQTPKYSNFSGLIYFNDEVELTVSSDNDCINAGTYSVDLSISGADSANYQLSSSRKEFTIAKAQISLVWTNLEQIYDKTTKSVTCTPTGFVSGEESLLKITYNNGTNYGGTSPVNADSYNVTASLTDSPNYEFASSTNETATLTIKPISITDLIWNVPTGLTYTTENLGTNVSCTSNQIISGDTVTFDYTFRSSTASSGSSGLPKCIDAGTYTVIARMTGTNTNYVLDPSANTEYESFVIGKANLQIDLTYGSNSSTITSSGTGTLHRQYYVMSNATQLAVSWSYYIAGTSTQLTVNQVNVEVSRTRFRTTNQVTGTSNNISTYGSITDTFLVNDSNFNTYQYSQSYDIYIARLTSNIGLIYNTTDFSGAYTSVDVALYASNTGTNGNYVFVYGNCVIGEVCSDLTIKSGLEFFLPHNGTVGYETYTQDTGLSLTDVGHANVGNRSASQLTEYLNVEIKSGANITLNGRITVGADRGQSNASTGASGRIEADTRTGYSTITLNGTITANSGSSIWCLGYIEGNGSILANRGANIYEPFTITDWRGGQIAGSVYCGSFNGTSIGVFDALAGKVSGGNNELENVVPFNQYGMHHIEVSTRINDEANLIGLAAIYTSEYKVAGQGPDAKWNTTPYTIIGSGALLEPIGSSSYIIKDYDSSTDKTTFELHGNIVDNPGVLRVVLLDDSNPLKLDTTELFFGLSHNLKIVVKEKATLSVGYKYKMLPGSEIIIDDGGTLNLSGSLIIYNENPGNSYPTNVEDASLVINGTMNVTGRFAGNSSSTSQGVLNLANASSLEITSNELTGTMTVDTGILINAKIVFTSKLIADNQSHHLYAYNSDDTQLTTTTYVWSTDTNAWETASNLNKFTINFYIEDEIKTVSIYQKAEETTYVVTGNEVPASKKFNKFVGWYTDSSYNTKFVSETLNSDESINLYAKFEEIVYEIEYTANLVTGDDITDITNLVTKPSIVSFTASQLPITIPSITYDGYFFSGWYVGSTKQEDAEAFNTITIDMLAELENSFGSTIQLCCEFKQVYTIEFDNNNSDINLSISNITNIDTSTYEAISEHYNHYLSYDTNIEYSKYFGGWYLDSNCTREFTGNTVLSDVADSSTGIITLYAKWVDKEIVITYQYVGSSTYRYYQDGTTSITIVNDDLIGTVASESNGTQLRYGSGWSYNGTHYDMGSSFELGNNTAYTFIRETETWYVVTIDTSRGGAIVTITSDYYVNGAIKANEHFDVSVSYSYRYRETIITVNGTEVYNESDSNLSTNESNIQATGPIVINSASSSNPNGCFETGTLITTNNGLKAVEDLTNDDLVLTFNHFTGEYEYKSITLVVFHGNNYYNVVELNFSDGSYIGIIESHGLFDITLNKYVDITPNNYKEFIGHQFVKYSNNTEEIITLNDAKLTAKYTGSYTVISSENLNCIANNLLNTTSVIKGLYNIFEYDDNKLFNTIDVQSSIELYGLFTYDDFKDLVSEQTYIDFGGKWLKIAIGKGILTEDMLKFYIEWYHQVINDGEAIVY